MVALVLNLFFNQYFFAGFVGSEEIAWEVKAYRADPAHQSTQILFLQEKMLLSTYINIFGENFVIL